MGKRKKAQASGSGFQFISVTGDSASADDATRRLVRSHAMVDYRRRTRAQNPTDTVELDVTPLLQGDIKLFQMSLPPMGPLGMGRSDPFNTFPLDGSYQSRQLWDHLYDGSCIMFRTMLDIGFLTVARETIALPQILSASSRHLDRLRGDNECQTYYRYTIQASSLLQKRLQDPVASTTDEVVTAVLAFCCYANMVRDPGLFNTHIAGLARILECRGGLASLDANPLLRTMLFWVDVNGSYLQDSMPRFPPPFTILNQGGITPIDIHMLDGTAGYNDIGESPIVTTILQRVRELQDVIQMESSRRELWQDVLFPGFHISPLLHDLLSLPRGTLHDGIDERVVEAFRLAVIIYLSELRGRFGVDTVPAELYGSKLLVLLQNTDTIVRWRGSSVLLLWVLTVGACASCLSRGLKTSFVNILRQSLASVGIIQSEEFRSTILGFLWSDSLGFELESLLQTLQTAI